MNAPQKKESPLLNLIVNILIPTLILMKLSKEAYLGPFWGLVVALMFPIGYGLYDFIIRRKVNFFSILGFASILLTGIIGLLALDPFWIAVKEATVPLLIGLAVIVSLRTRYPLVKKLVYNDQLLNIANIEAKLAEKGNETRFEKRLVKASYWIAASFLVSAVLNYGLARYLIVSMPGTSEFNEELGQMQALSLPVIAVPSTLMLMGVLWWLVKSIQTLTDLPFEEVFNVKE